MKAGLLFLGAYYITKKISFKEWLKTPVLLLMGAASVHYLFSALPGSKTGAFVTFAAVLGLAWYVSGEADVDALLDEVDTALGVEPVQEQRGPVGGFGRRSVRAGEVVHAR